MKILFLGDVVGSPGRAAVKALLPAVKQAHGVDLVVVNAENSAGGSGITPRTARDLFQSGCNVLTSGDHIWRRPDVVELLDQNRYVLRPANFPKVTPGHGSTVWTFANGVQAGVVCLLGRVFIDAMVDSPFRVIEEELSLLKEKTKIILVDMHAEATSEKIAMGWFLDGRVSAVLGTHTHIQTADEKILPQGTAYITDVGMTGPYDSVIGRKKEKIIERFMTAMPSRFELGTGDVQMHGVVVDVDETSGRARSIIRIREKMPQHGGPAHEHEDEGKNID